MCTTAGHEPTPCNVWGATTTVFFNRRPTAYRPCRRSYRPCPFLTIFNTVEVDDGGFEPTLDTQSFANT